MWALSVSSDMRGLKHISRRSIDEFHFNQNDIFPFHTNNHKLDERLHGKGEKWRGKSIRSFRFIHRLLFRGKLKIEFILCSHEHRIRQNISDSNQRGFERTKKWTVWQPKMFLNSQSVFENLMPIDFRSVRIGSNYPRPEHAVFVNSTKQICANWMLSFHGNVTNSNKLGSNYYLNAVNELFWARAEIQFGSTIRFVRQKKKICSASKASNPEPSNGIDINQKLWTSVMGAGFMP